MNWLWWLLVVFLGSYFSFFVFFPNFLFFVGVNHYGLWFLDTYAILASNDAITRGLDPYAVNPLDPFGRPHVYTHWWLHLRELGFTRADNFAAGASLVVAFFVATIARLRPRSVGELLWYLAVACSSSVLLAVNRANNDLLIFVLLAPVAPCLLSSRRWLRLSAAGLVALAAGFKFYPAVAGLVLLDGEDSKDVRGQVIFGVLLLAAVGIDLAPDVARFGALSPKAEGIMTFGAVNLLTSCGLKGGAVSIAALAVAVAIFAGFWRSRLFEGWVISPAGRGPWLSFILGAVLLTGCFFTNSNFAYRWVFALWLAPLLWQLPQDHAAPQAVRGLAWATLGLLLVALWLDPVASVLLGNLQGHAQASTIVRLADRIFFWEQPFTWALFACLLGFLAHFTRAGVRKLWGSG